MTLYSWQDTLKHIHHCLSLLCCVVDCNNFTNHCTELHNNKLENCESVRFQYPDAFIQQSNSAGLHRRARLCWFKRRRGWRSSGWGNTWGVERFSFFPSLLYFGVKKELGKEIIHCHSLILKFILPFSPPPISLDKVLFFFFFGLQDLSSLTRDWTHALSSESMESYPLESQRIP